MPLMYEAANLGAEKTAPKAGATTVLRRRVRAKESFKLTQSPSVK